MTCDRYGSKSITTYSKGTTSYGIVTATSPTKYKSGERNSDGYWYTYVGIK